MIALTKCKDKSVISVILRAPTSHILDEFERGIDDALHAVETAIKDGKIVPGGAAVETELSLRLRQYASTIKGKEQLSINAFAEALEIIPKALAMNAGLNPIDSMIELKTKHDGKQWQELRAERLHRQSRGHGQGGRRRAAAHQDTGHPERRRGDPDDPEDRRRARRYPGQGTPGRRRRDVNID